MAARKSAVSVTWRSVGEVRRFVEPRHPREKTVGRDGRREQVRCPLQATSSRDLRTTESSVFAGRNDHQGRLLPVSARRRRRPCCEEGRGAGSRGALLFEKLSCALSGMANPATSGVAIGNRNINDRETSGCGAGSRLRRRAISIVLASPRPHRSVSISIVMCVLRVKSSPPLAAGELL